MSQRFHIWFPSKKAKEKFIDMQELREYSFHEPLPILENTLLKTKMSGDISNLKPYDTDD